MADRFERMTLESTGGVPIIIAKVVTNARENCQVWFEDRRGEEAAHSWSILT